MVSTSSTLSTALVLALIYSTTLAQTCITSNAYPLEQLLKDNSPSSSKGGSSGGSSGGSYPPLIDYNSFLNGLQNQQNAATLSGGNLFANAAGARRRGLHKRDMECTSSEICLSSSNDPFCIDPKTYDFRASDGKGNLETGDYVLDNGKKGNLYVKNAGEVYSSAVTAGGPSATATGGSEPVKSTSTAAASAAVSEDKKGDAMKGAKMGTGMGMVLAGVVVGGMLR